MRVRTELKPEEAEAAMGQKDKGGTNVKKKAQHSLKEKREAKKIKKASK